VGPELHARERFDQRQVRPGRVDVAEHLVGVGVDDQHGVFVHLNH